MTRLIDLPEMIVRDVAELPDRTSPEDQPDMMLVTVTELDRIVTARVAEVAAADDAREALEIIANSRDAEDAEDGSNLYTVSRELARDTLGIKVEPAGGGHG